MPYPLVHPYIYIHFLIDFTHIYIYIYIRGRRINSVCVCVCVWERVHFFFLFFFCGVGSTDLSWEDFHVQSSGEEFHWTGNIYWNDNVEHQMSIWINWMNVLNVKESPWTKKLNPYYFSHLRVLIPDTQIPLWNLSDSKSPQLSRTLLSISANLISAVVCMVSTPYLISNSIIIIIIIIWFSVFRFVQSFTGSLLKT